MADNVEWNAICAWLESLNYGHYVGAFEENGFDLWEIIRELSVDDLKEAGIKTGHAMRIHKKIPAVDGSVEHKEVMPEAEAAEENESVPENRADNEGAADEGAEVSKIKGVFALKMVPNDPRFGPEITS